MGSAHRPSQIGPDRGAANRIGGDERGWQATSRRQVKQRSALSAMDSPMMAWRWPGGGSKGWGGLTDSSRRDRPNSDRARSNRRPNEPARPATGVDWRGLAALSTASVSSRQIGRGRRGARVGLGLSSGWRAAGLLARPVICTQPDGAPIWPLKKTGRRSSSRSGSWSASS